MYELQIYFCILKKLRRKGWPKYKSNLICLCLWTFIPHLQALLFVVYVLRVILKFFSFLPHLIVFKVDSIIKTKNSQKNIYIFI